MNDKWKVWDGDEGYGEVLYKRATGELPEMESSKKIARVLKRHISDGTSVLDVGCGAGHYLRSLRRECGDSFSYLGVDATKNYIEQAKKAFQSDNRSDFSLADIYDIQLEDSSFDIVMCNNVFLHLPSIIKPISELIRVARGYVVVRLLAGNRSFQIKDIAPQNDGCDFNENGEPVEWHFYNIYSNNYIDSLLKTNKKVKSWTINADFDYQEANIVSSVKDHGKAHDASTMLGGYQLNGYIIQPWSIIEIELTR
jgi:ubiquinone/menaquinone biosynthesis C-methylase UbiE